VKEAKECFKMAKHVEKFVFEKLGIKDSSELKRKIIKSKPV
jgi:hypothetical protein